MNEPIPSRKKRTRSPAYPSISLPQALDKAGIIWAKASRHYVGINEAVKFWGYEETSSAGHGAISALKKFGLVEEQGAGEGREIRLTDIGISLVFNPDKASHGYLDALKVAALLPSIHAELWNKYGGILPDNSIIERYLVVERSFNENYAKSFISQFRETISFAGLVDGDMLPMDQESTTQVKPTVQSQALVPSKPAQILQVGQSMPIPIAGADGRLTGSYTIIQPNLDSRREIRLPHPAGDISIKGPFPMSEADWKTFTHLMGAFKAWLVKEEPTPSASSTASAPPAAQSPSGALD